MRKAQLSLLDYDGARKHCSGSLGKCVQEEVDQREENGTTALVRASGSLGSHVESRAGDDSVDSVEQEKGVESLAVTPGELIMALDASHNLLRQRVWLGSRLRDTGCAYTLNLGLEVVDISWSRSMFGAVCGNVSLQLVVESAVPERFREFVRCRRYRTNVVTANGSLGHRGDGSQKIRSSLSSLTVVTNINKVLTCISSLSRKDHSTLV